MIQVNSFQNFYELSSKFKFYITDLYHYQLNNRDEYLV
jgi:hypothetical protein